MTRKVKIVVIGNQDSGKTVFSNIISGQQTDIGVLTDFTRSTSGVRIIEFESEIGNQTFDVELWDCSGDLEKESLWSVFADEMDGLILMTKEDISESYADFFCETNIQKEQSLLWINGSSEAPKPEKVGYKVVYDILAEVEKTKSKFNKFLSNCAQVSQRQQERDERILTN